MRHTYQTASIDFSYLAVLLLLAYVLASGPKYVRQLKSDTSDIKIEKVSPVKEVLKLGKYYGIDPYVRAWSRLSPSIQKTNPATSNQRLAAIRNPASR